MIKIFVALFVIDFIDIEEIVCLFTFFIDFIFFFSNNAILGSFHIRKKHSDRMIGDNVESLREYIGEFQPNTMTAEELKEILSHPLAPPSASLPTNGTSNQMESLTSLGIQQPNPPHAFRCGYCKFSSVNSGDVKKHQTWKHANLLSNILPIDPNDPQQQPMVSYKRKRIHSTKTTLSEDEGPTPQRPRLSVPVQRQLTIDTSAAMPDDQDSTPKGIIFRSIFRD